MTSLSPASHAVLDAYYWAHPVTHPADQKAVAAALRAAADQVAPEPSNDEKQLLSIAALRYRWQIRDRLFAIAAELESHQ